MLQVVCPHDSSVRCLDKEATSTSATQTSGAEPTAVTGLNVKPVVILDMFGNFVCTKVFNIYELHNLHDNQDCEMRF